MKRILGVLIALVKPCRECRKASPRGYLEARIAISERKHRMERLIVSLTDTQKCTLSIAPKDAGGNAATIDGVPAWTNSNSSLVTMDVAPDGLSAVVTTIDGSGLGECDIGVTADADLGSGVENLELTFHVTVGGDKAVTLGGQASSPESRLP